MPEQTVKLPEAVAKKFKSTVPQPRHIFPGDKGATDLRKITLAQAEHIAKVGGGILVPIKNAPTKPDK